MMTTSPVKLIEIWQKALQEHGYRLTSARRVVMNILAASETSLTPQEIYGKARDEGLSLSLASVYRTLEALESFNLIQQIHQPGGCQAYWPTLIGNKHFIICKKCGRMEVFEGLDDLNDLFIKVEKDSGYIVQEHWLQFFGLCKQCQ